MEVQEDYFLEEIPRRLCLGAQASWKSVRQGQYQQSAFAPSGASNFAKATSDKTADVVACACGTGS